jgi:pilus assembly protein CpaB
MSRIRRAALLLGLALVLGGLAASDVARREAALDRELGPAVDVVVARRDLESGRRVRLGDLGLRRIPRRFAPAGAAAAPEDVVGGRLAVPVARDAFISRDDFATGERPAAPPVRPGERTAEVVAAGSPEFVVAGARVDVLVTREGRDGLPGATELALEDVEVLDAAPAPEAESPRGAGVPRLVVTLRVGVRRAVYLAAAQAFAREIRLLPRAPEDRRRAGAIAVQEGLR